MLSLVSNTAMGLSRAVRHSQDFSSVLFAVPSFPEINSISRFNYICSMFSSHFILHSAILEIHECILCLSNSSLIVLFNPKYKFKECDPSTCLSPALVMTFDRRSYIVSNINNLVTIFKNNISLYEFKLKPSPFYDIYRFKNELKT